MEAKEQKDVIKRSYFVGVLAGIILVTINNFFPTNVYGIIYSIVLAFIVILGGQFLLVRITSGIKE